MTEPLPEAEPLVHSAAKADLIGALFDRHCRSLYRYVVVRMGGDAQLADDVMQQVWVAALRTGRSVPADEIEFWLRGVARNILAAHRRRLANRPKQLPLADRVLASELAEALESSPLPPELMDKKETKDQLLLALTQLPSDAQELIAGRYFRGWTVERLADTLGLSVRAAEGRLYRARQALKQALAHLEE
ncbi:MAG: sigma-70 family RNA polymerase sigma factor [Planctomycetes bacterium]|nr:sigma-70 family RNA polymerase sigma factor [Planctomycetota bacterium]